MATRRGKKKRSSRKRRAPSFKGCVCAKGATQAKNGACFRKMKTGRVKFESPKSCPR